MRFGIGFSNIMFFADGPGATAMGEAAEAAGFESVWPVEHVLIPEGYESEYPYDPSGRMPGDGMVDMPDPLIWLTWVAARTATLKLGTGILIVPQRNAAVLAKEVASLDRLSGGRLLLGVGAGWLAEEFDALGVPFADRGRRLDDTIAAMRALWTEDRASYDGTHWSFTNAVSLPKPAQGSVPIIVGGHSPAAARRAGRLGDGFFPGRGDDEELPALLELMRRSAAEAGRDPATIEVTTVSPALLGSDPLREVERLDALGVHRALVPPPSFTPGDLGEVLADFGDRVIRPAGG